MLFNVVVSKGAPRTESFDSAKLPQSSIDYLIQYGLNQSINDAHASIKKDDPKVRELVAVAVSKRVTQIRTGAVPSLAGRVDPLRAKAQELGLTDSELLAIMATAAAKKKSAA